MRLGLLLSLMLLSLGLQAEIVVEDAKIYATAPGQANAAALMILKNTDETPLTLTTLRSDVAKKVQMHEQIKKNGLLRMQQIKQFTLPAKGQALLEHGATHIMLMDLKQPLKPDDVVSIELCFGELCVTPKITVKSLQAMNHHHHHH